MWVETVTEFERRVTATWRQYEKYAAKHSQEMREANGTKKVVIVHESVEPVKRHRSVQSTRRRYPENKLGRRNPARCTQSGSA